MNTPAPQHSESSQTQGHVPGQTRTQFQHHSLAAMVLEVSAPKAGNVHKNAAFEDVTWLDFVTSAIVTSPILAQAHTLGVGRCILDCVKVTRQAVGSNTNLGMLLLLAPLNAAAGDAAAVNGPRDVQRVLDALTQDDAELVYQAIALAKPGGLGKAAKGDVTRLQKNQPVPGLVEAMGLAADRDTVAKQYVNGFADVFEVAQNLAEALSLSATSASPLSLDEAIVLAHLQLMARVPDTLIARKLGKTVAQESALRAQEVLASNWPTGKTSQASFKSLDHWLRADGHKRNPGTSADLIAAALWVVLRQGKIQLPHRWRENLWS